ncbi:MAG: six-cysteine ranthipeptide SCIFF [Clostridia bacterium]|nr:six-cysteine ranthipeptide SCIFF [Clostridia bacterium]MBR2070750.1 six-cysteine ranthipeptide SCIFF [Clostridia bacterium]MBR2160241.1 six-cysteine ranthipeptide SCIFF [Clostridia bacterium]MBR2323896.1 six-cysteine ranthipeptide SCIFF [Clostridia bacterium]MBR2398231.1 six-cysteine ranthipeptide SCIFF [Clostridia bacterium]
MSRITTITTNSMCKEKSANCGECRSSCQSACKTSCTVGNQACDKKAVRVKGSKKEQI